MAAGDGKLVRNWTGGRHFLENALPDTALGPTIGAVVEGRRWPKGWRNVAPAASCFQHMQDAGNDRPIVHARFSRLAERSHDPKPADRGASPQRVGGRAGQPADPHSNASFAAEVQTNSRLQRGRASTSDDVALHL